jgi:ribulose-phosphate 3-epimerase
MRAGVALNPATPLSAVEEVVEELDLLLVMSVNPGFGGQPFWDPAIDKVRRARAMLAARKSRALLEVDGGVARETIGQLAAAGADTFVAGVAVFGAQDAAAEVRELRRLAQAGAADIKKVRA